MTLTKNQENFELTVCPTSLNKTERQFLDYWKLIQKCKTENEKIHFFNQNPLVFNLKSGTRYNYESLDEEWSWDVQLYDEIKIRDQVDGSDELCFGENLNGIIKEYIYRKTPEGGHESDFDI